MPRIYGSAIARKHKQEIVERLGRGESITKVAHDIGYKTHMGIIQRLGDDPDFQAAVRSGVIGRLEHRERELEDVNVRQKNANVAVTRADRLLGHARWLAERLDPQRFGARIEGGAGGVVVQVTVVNPIAAVQTADSDIDGLAERVQGDDS